MTPLMQQFIDEARDLLESIGAQLMAMEQAPASAAMMAELFRQVHSLKGNSGLFDFPEMTRVLHAAEDLMGAVRDGRVAYSPALADRLLDAMDFIAVLVDDIATHEAIGPEHQAPSVALAKALRALMAAANPDTGLAAQGGGADEGGQDAAAGVPLHALPEAARAPAEAAARQGRPVSLVTYTPEPECYFKGEDPFLHARQAPGILWHAVRALEPWPALESMDCYRSVLEFTMLSDAPRAELDTYFRYVPEQVRIDPLAMAAPATAPAAPAPHMLAVLETQAAILALPDGDAWLPGRLRAVAATLGACFSPAHGAAIAAALEAALAENRSAPLRDWLAAQMAARAGGDAGVPASAHAIGNPASAAGRERGGEDDARFGRRADDVQIGKVLKVDQAKVERMMDLIGEMVVAKNSLPYLASRAENQFGVRELARDIKAQYAVINRIAEEMQDAIMQVRMMPVSVVLQRFPRLVRDISRRLGKEVDLVLEGEDTEADKNIVEVLADPLMHIVRNSLDHGFETPEQRVAAGKPRGGKLVIRASQESDRVRIEISDDGRGIDPVQVRAKAVAKGVIDAAQAERLTDAQAQELVFAPGFSTADAVTDLSGRGVGMDVVRTALSNAGGALELHSVPGAGTTLRLSLPLSVAVTNVMVVESDGQIFGVPMDLVVESVRLPMAAIRTIKQSMTTVLRGAIVPLVALNALLALPAEPLPNADNELAALVVRAGGERVGLLVDQFRGVIDVLLKPLPGELGRMSCYAGSALLGDGSVLMVLNPKEML